MFLKEFICFIRAARESQSAGQEEAETVMSVKDFKKAQRVGIEPTRHFRTASVSRGPPAYPTRPSRRCGFKGGL